MHLQKQILVVVFGCFRRSFRISQPNQKRKIFDVLTKENIGWQLVYVDNDIDFIDGVQVDHSDKHHFADARIVRLTQTTIDERIKEAYPSFFGLFNAPHYTDDKRLAALRNSYLETEVASLLGEYESRFQYSIVFCADYWFEKEWNIAWMNSTEIIISDQNPAAGYTNGFYSGPTKLLSKFLNSFGSFNSFKPLDYEHILLHRSEEYALPIQVVNFRFLKIRATGEPAYQENKRLWARVHHIAVDYFLTADLPIRQKLRFFFDRPLVKFGRYDFRRLKNLWRAVKSTIGHA